MTIRWQDVSLPTLAADPRQAMFFAAVDKVQCEHDEIESPNTYTGFLASSVNLGFIQETIRTLYTAHRITCANDVADFVCYAVQRVKRVRVENDSSGKCIYVYIDTKDDRGWYAYMLSIYHAEGIRLHDAPGYGESA